MCMSDIHAENFLYLQRGCKYRTRECGTRWIYTERKKIDLTEIIIIFYFNQIFRLFQHENGSSKIIITNIMTEFN